MVYRSGLVHSPLAVPGSDGEAASPDQCCHQSPVFRRRVSASRQDLRRCSCCNCGTSALLLGQIPNEGFRWLEL